MAELCVYCGEREGTTSDHVPPKALFPKPRPVDLVTVPCCESCRSGQSLDDEYLVQMLAVRNDIADHPAAAQVLPAVHRSFANPRKRGFNRAFAKSIRGIDIKTDAGLYLGTAPGYSVDLERFARVLRRTTIGLLYDHLEKRLPSGHNCIVYPLDGLSAKDLAPESPVRMLMDHALTGTPRVWGEKVFTRWYQELDDIQGATVWVFLIYSKVAFFAVTGPKSKGAA